MTSVCTRQVDHTPPSTLDCRCSSKVAASSTTTHHLVGTEPYHPMKSTHFEIDKGAAGDHTYPELRQDELQAGWGGVHLGDLGQQRRPAVLARLTTRMRVGKGGLRASPTGAQKELRALKNRFFWRRIASAEAVALKVFGRALKSAIAQHILGSGLGALHNLHCVLFRRAFGLLLKQYWVRHTKSATMTR